MPVIFFYGPALDREKAKDMISSFTETTSRVTGIDKSKVIVCLREAPPEASGVGGELLEDVIKRSG